MASWLKDCQSFFDASLLFLCLSTFLMLVATSSFSLPALLISLFVTFNSFTNHSPFVFSFLTFLCLEHIPKYHPVDNPEPHISPQGLKSELPLLYPFLV